jgi:hypothetical protein
MKLFILSVLLLTSHSYAFEAFEIKPTHSSEAHMYQKAILIDSDGIESEVQVKTFGSLTLYGPTEPGPLKFNAIEVAKAFFII